MIWNPYLFFVLADYLDIFPVFDNNILIIFTVDLVKIAFYFNTRNIELSGRSIEAAAPRHSGLEAGK